LSVKYPSSPTPPKGGVIKQDSKISEATETRFQEFKSGYPDGIVDLDAARREFGKLPDADQVSAIAAVQVYAARCRARREKSLKAHLFIRKRAWEGLLASATRQQGITEHPPHSPAGRALLTLGRIARYQPLRLSSGNISFMGDITPALLALADTPDERDWGRYDRGTANYAAWRDLIFAVFAGRALPALTAIEAPWPWPPRKDGSITTGPPEGLTQDDADALTAI
jgi:hypothetical protein